MASRTPTFPVFSQGSERYKRIYSSPNGNHKDTEQRAGKSEWSGAGAVQKIPLTMALESHIDEVCSSSLVGSDEQVKEENRDFEAQVFGEVQETLEKMKDLIETLKSDAARSSSATTKE